MYTTKNESSQSLTGAAISTPSTTLTVAEGNEPVPEAPPPNLPPRLPSTTPPTSAQVSNVELINFTPIKFFLVLNFCF